MLDGPYHNGRNEDRDFSGAKEDGGPGDEPPGEIDQADELGRRQDPDEQDHGEEEGQAIATGGHGYSPFVAVGVNQISGSEHDWIRADGSRQKYRNAAMSA